MKHDVIEKNVGLMIVLTLVALSFGTLVELVPLMFAKETNEPIAGLKPPDPITRAKDESEGSSRSRPCNWKAATSMFARAAIPATRR